MRVTKKMFFLSNQERKSDRRGVEGEEEEKEGRIQTPLYSYT